MELRAAALEERCARQANARSAGSSRADDPSSALTAGAGPDSTVGVPLMPAESPAAARGAGEVMPWLSNVRRTGTPPALMQSACRLEKR